MAALQAGRFARSGVAVLLIDLSGCGDSSGDFGDATWETWNDDLAAAWRWLRARGDGPIHLWGLRLGALLGLDFARRMAVQPASFLLWQPVTSGEAFLTQFLRLVLANEMLSAGSAKSGTSELRERLAGGEGLEIAGYRLSANLARAIDALRLDGLTPAAGAVHWLEVVPATGRPLPPGTQRAVEAWRKSGVTVNVHTVAGEPFWATQEITECRELLDATTAILDPSR